MGNSFRGRSFVVAVFLFISLSVPLISAESGIDESGIGTKDLGRRSKIHWMDKLKAVNNEKNDPDSYGVDVDSGLGVFDAFFASLSMILVSEIGDETFIIAALMAMRHPKAIVLSGALSALFVMTILSTGLGRIVPNLISRKHTNSAATVLYAFFGLRLLYIAWKSDPKASQKKEIEEVEEKLEAGQGKTTWRRFFSRFCTPIYLESFILTFLAEWGDRSQIATIALATHKNAVGVAVGATIGHTICTSVAVIGGSMLASRISQRTVATVGGLLFLGFSVSSHPDFEHARNLFDEIPERDVRTWTLLISALSKSGYHSIALHHFAAMQREGAVAANAFTLSSVLKCCASLLHGLRVGKAVHGWIITNDIEVDVALDNAVLDFYAKFRLFGWMERFFESMDERDSTSWNIVMATKMSEGEAGEALDLFRRLLDKSGASWNTIIDGLLQQGLKEEALELLYQMVELRHPFNGVTFSISLALASSLKNSEMGRQIHGRLVRAGMDQDSFVGISLLDMYCKCREMHKASVVFRQKRGRGDSMVRWSTMIAGCVQNGLTEDAMSYFRSMIVEKLKIDLFTLTTILTASADRALLELGQQIHAHTLKLGHGEDVCLCSSLIDMYAKCGKLGSSWSYFRETKTRNVVLWSAMISSYATHGLGNEAIQLFELMRKEGIKPNEVSFLGVLTACSHAGLVDDGCWYFNMMRDGCGVRPGVEHFACVIDLLGRAGHLKEMKDFIYENKIDHLKEVWKAYLSCCWLHKNVEMANWASKKLLELDPSQPEPYLLSSNTYSANDAWDKAAKVRGLMLEKEVRKLPGQSWI
ncbi:hypothetical protein SASPL_153319 [Salvia splendens]|uniref:GDT1 family protein n=1 Tax=Salvia splendens TaxID=180675 RepID=A0A8X8W4Z4_SALSN|nr:hypothetical protein SASPL_153319 [Salvia splendens]